MGIPFCIYLSLGWGYEQGAYNFGGFPFRYGRDSVFTRAVTMMQSPQGPASFSSHIFRGWCGGHDGVDGVAIPLALVAVASDWVLQWGGEWAVPRNRRGLFLLPGRVKFFDCEKLVV